MKEEQGPDIDPIRGVLGAQTHRHCLENLTLTIVIYFFNDLTCAPCGKKVNAGMSGLLMSMFMFPHDFLRHSSERGNT